MSPPAPETSSPAEPPSARSKRPVAAQQRSKVRILVDIMRAVAEDGEARPTRILYGANLSSDRLGKYLDELVSKKLIDKRDGDDGTRYALTKEGRAFLVEFRRIEEFSSAFGIEF